MDYDIFQSGFTGIQYETVVGRDIARQYPGTVDTVAALAALAPAAFRTVRTVGRLSPNDGWGREYYWAGGDQSAAVSGDPDHYTVVAPAAYPDGESGAWLAIQSAGSIPYTIGFCLPGEPTGGVPVFSHIFAETVTFPSGLTGSRADALIAPTDAAVMAICYGVAGDVGYSQIGAITWAADNPVPTLTMTEKTFGAGDKLIIINQSEADDTLADIAVTIVGWR